MGVVVVVVRACLCVWGGFGRFVLRGKAQTVGVLTKKLLRGGGGITSAVSSSGSRRSPSACSRSNCRGRGESGITSAALSSGARRSPSACTRSSCRGRGGGRKTSVGFGVDDVKNVRRRANDDCAALVEGLEVQRHGLDGTLGCARLKRHPG